MLSKVTLTGSAIHGKGVFATRKIKKGEMVLNCKGKEVLDKDFDRIVPPSLQEVCFQIGKSKFICPFSQKEIPDMFFTNHSCNPNCGVKDSVMLIAITDIDAGEEITFDYCMTDANFEGLVGRPNPKFICKCGSVNCRKVITGEDWKDNKLQEKYKGYFSEYIQKMIANSLK